MNKLLVLIMAGMANLASAQQATFSYPSKTVRIIVPFAAGGTSDVLARTIGQKLAENWGQPVVIENKPGADGNLGADYVAKAAPDGYTVLLVDTSTLTISPLVMAKLDYVASRDLVPVNLVSFSPYGLVINQAFPAKDFRQLQAYGNANPGKLNFSSGTLGHKFFAAQMKNASGMDMATIPYKGGAASMNAVVAGEADMTVVGLMSVIPQVQGGRVRALAVTSPKRSALMPDVPTLGESGVPNVVAGSWQGVLVPKGTSVAVVQKLNASIASVLADASVQTKLTSMGTEAVGDGPEKFAFFLAKDSAQWKAVAQAAGIKPE